ncbi:MAG: fibronectin type III domain-containing protein, partial [Flavobacteriales bacterium]|nr:fibronectin type III domain-containing protein [Flavobacteriales bacterium]
MSRSIPLPSTGSWQTWWQKAILLLLLIAFGAWLMPAKAQTGNVCGTPIVVTSLPYSDAGNTSSYGDDYSASDVPPVAPGAVTNGTGSTSYIDGDDVVYAYTPSVDQGITISTTNDDDWIGLWAFTGCPFSSTVGYHTATSGATRSIPGLTLTGGTTYYFVISTWPNPQSTAYTISITLDWISAFPCTGTPTVGTLPTTVPVCSGSTTTLVPDGAELELDLTYLWEESADGTTWSAATGTNNEATYTTPPFSVPTYYRQVVTCDNSSESDTTNVAQTVQLTTPPYYAYDGTSYLQSFESWVDGCQTSDMPSINWANTPATGDNSWRRNDQGASAGWTTPNAGMYSPASTNGSYSARFHSVGAPSGSQGALDFYVDLTNNSGNAKLSFDYINPTTGTDQLRVHLSVDGGATFTPLAAALGQASSWTTVEYGIPSTSATAVIRFRATGAIGSTDIGLDNVHLFEPCAGTPATATATANPATICAGGTSVITATGVGGEGGITLQWEQSNDGVSGWTPITGANSATYTTPALTVPRYFRVVVGCTYSGLSSTSNAAGVQIQLPTYAVYNNVSFAEGFEAWSNSCDSADVPGISWRNIPFTGNPSWRRNDQGGAAAWTTPTSGVYTPTFSQGAYSARFHSNNAPSASTGDLDLFIDMSAATGITRLTMDVANTSGTDKLQVFLSTDGGLSFSQVGDDILFQATPTWNTHTVDFSSNSATTVIRLRATSDFGTTDIGVDNLQLAPAPSCIEASDLAATSTGSFSWTASPSAPSQGYEWEVRSSGAPGSGPTGLDDSGTTAAGVTNASASGLTPYDTYTVYVRASCGGGDYSAWTEGVTFTYGMSQIGTGTTTNTNFPIYSCTAYNYTQQIYPAASYTAGQYITKIAFKYVSSGTTIANWSNWTVYLGNTGQSDFATTTSWVPLNELQQVFSGTVTPVAGQWMEINLSPGFLWDGTSNIVVAVDENSPGTSCTATWSSFTSVANSGIYRRITTDIDPANPGTATGRSGTLAQIQIFSGDMPNCMPPTGLTVSNVTATGADFAWTASVTTPDAYAWEVRDGSTVIDNGSTTGTAANTSLLAPNTTYGLYVASVCGGDSSAWAGPYGFTTPCVSANVPYTENFNGVTTPALPACMSLQTISGNAWRTAPAPVGMTGNTANVSYTPSGSPDMNSWLFTQGLNLTGGTSYRLTYKYFNNSTTWAERMSVSYGAGNSAANMTTQLADHSAIQTTTVQTNTVEFTPATTGIFFIGFKCYSIADQNQLYLDDIQVIETPSCEAPTHLAASNITANSADLSWWMSSSNPANGYEWEVRSSGVGGDPSPDASGSTAAGNDTTATASGLAPSTTYALYVRSNCGGNYGPWAGPYSFTTSCLATNVPYSEDFNGVTAPALPVCMSNQTITGPAWQTYAFPPTGMTGNSARCYDYVTVDSWLYTAGLNLTGGQSYRLSFKYSNQYDFYVDALKVAYGTSPLASAMTTTIVDHPAIDDGAVHEDVIEFVPATTGIYYIGFQKYSNSGTDDAYMYLDDIQVIETPSCEAPTHLAAANITTTGADLSWWMSSSNPASGYEWEVRSSGVGGDPSPDASGSTATATDTTASASGLLPSTTYTLYVRANCGGDYSAWAASGTFQTLCDAFTMPFQEGFNSLSTTKACWTVLNVNGDADSWDMNYATNPYEGDQCAMMYTDFNAGANDDWLISPGLVLTGNERLLYHYRVQSASEPNDMEVLLSTTGTAPADFTNTLVALANYSNTTYAEQMVDLSAYTGTVYIAWHVPPGGLDGWRLYIDNVIVEAIPSCLPPTGLAAANITTTSADLSWTASTSNPANGYQWEVRTSGAPGSGATGLTDSGTTAAGITTASSTLLTANTSYSLYVRSDCDADGFSEWAGPMDFFTGYCIPVGTNSAYYINDFTTTGGSTNIANSGSGFSPGGYGDFTAQTATQAQGSAISFTANITGGTAGFRIWVDWNQNLVFDPTEVAYASTGYASSHTGSFTVPPTALPGTTRMRIVSHWLSSTGDIDPCSTTHGYGEFEDYSLDVLIPSCLVPTGVNVSLTAPTVAELGWTDNGAASYDYELRTSGAAGSGATGLVASGSASSGTPAIVLSPLLPNTTYTAYVRSDCGGTQSEWASVVFSTPLTTPAPWLESFATTSTPAGWAVTGWTLGSARGVTGNPAYNIYKNIWNAGSSGTSFSTIAVGPVSAADVLSFDHKASNYAPPYNPPASGSGNFVVAISTDFGATYTTLETVTNDGVAGWRTKTYPLTAYAGEYVKVRITGNWTSGDWDYGFDNFKIEVPPTCLPPTGLAVSNISPTGADLGWTASTSNPANGYKWEVRQGATVVASGTTAAGVTTASASGLTANTNYGLYVRSDCGGGDLSPWAGPVSFYTGYCQVTSTSTSYGISNFTTTGGYTNIANPSGPGSYSDYTAQSVSASAGGSVGFSITSASGTAGMGIWIDWNNNLVFDPSEQVYNAGTYVSTGTGTITVPAGQANGNYRMRVVANWSATNPTPCDNLGAAAYGEAEDYTFAVIAAPTCLPPTGLAASNITANSADLSWTASPSNPADGYVWEVRQGVTVIDNGTTAAGVTTANASGLTANTTYGLYVRSDCGGGNLSPWAGPVSFYTGYCQVTSTSTTYGISNFTTTGGYTNIANTSGPGSYSDYTAQSVSASAGGSVGFSITSANSTAGMRIWIDWNNNLVFDPSEQVYNAGGYVSIGTGTITVPAGQAIGNYRMRVVANWLSSSPTPCGDLGYQGYGEAEDYTFTVAPAPTCLSPTNLGVGTVGTTTATFTWTASTSNPANGYAWEVRQGVTVVASGTTAGTTASASGLASSTAYSLYVRANCGGGDLSFWAGPLNFSTGAACGDPFYDTGGASANYGTNENWVKTYCATDAGGQVRVLFNSFYTEANWDKLFVFNGPDTNAPKFASSNGAGSGNTSYGTGGWWGNLNSNLPGPFTSSNPSGCLTFAFVSDGSGQYAGWEAITQCLETNRNCSNAFEVLCGGNYPGNTAGLAHSMPGDACAFNGPASTGGQNWWRYEGTGNNAVTFSTCSDAGFDTRISVFSGTACGSLDCVAMNDDYPGCANGGSSVTINTTAGTMYWIVVHGPGNAGGSYTLSVSCGAPCTPPANDNCNSAQALANNLADGSNSPATYTNACATGDAPTTCSGAMPVQGVWFTFNSGNYGHALLTLVDNGDDAQYSAGSLDYALYSGSCAGMGATASVACVA